MATVLLHLGSDGLGFLELRPSWPFSNYIWWPNQFNYTIAFVGEVLIPLALLAWGLSVFRRERISMLELLSPRLDRSIARCLERHAEAPPAESVSWTVRTVLWEVVVHVVLWVSLATVCHFVFLVYDRPRWPDVLGIALLPLIVVRWILPWLVQRGLVVYARACETGDSSGPDGASG